ncbi:techylectin-5B-like [Tachypleus tridentatus]|uniref:techylectin-5B-like n=1 Tax=Tachypleus tridentatus TaxID=6853 RepID=UPI003FD41AB9
MYNTVKILSILTFFVLTQADVRHQTACNTVGSLKGIVDSVTELVDLARERISTLEGNDIIFSLNNQDNMVLCVDFVLRDIIKHFNTASSTGKFLLIVRTKQKQKADVHHHTACNAVGSLKGIVDSVTELVDLAREKISTLEGCFHETFKSKLAIIFMEEKLLFLIQRRGDFGKPVENFYRSWVEYKNGFGNLTQEFWSGNGVIFSLTNQDSMVLRVDLEDFEGSRRYAEFEGFLVRSEIELYKMSYKTYKGDAGNSLAPHQNMMFSTKDKDNDKYSGSCAHNHKGGWWYNSCHRCNLNGLYYTEDKVDSTGITWYEWKSEHITLKTSEMKIRPAEFTFGK